ncbi:carboxymuconolactone decarboxylase family protein [Pseudomonas sp. PDM14]|uniref:carboxymuconolactone decarboxylase family protein n=1 Tax=Pseudomonas sp. PDM14 TaxID=2769288 RepID=UPI001783C7CC|nr:carboxymuconolactone decarboxylase family protein [Pseudomonas sp. PDM14]MBD9482009.1 carboxymuconolactone decarboxylase family protein [Pseudomonas sp. PDM14]
MPPRLDYYTASPEALRGMLLLEASLSSMSLEKPLLELVKVRASQLNHCAFCADMHSTDARLAGVAERHLHALAVWRESPFFSRRERAALAWTEAMTLLAQSHAPDEVYGELSAAFSEREQVDLTMAISAINCWNRLAVGFRKQPQA